MTQAYHHAKTTLDNGLTVVTVSMPHLHSASVSLYARVGSRHETADTNGISHFLEHMFFRGCDGYADSTALNSAMEDLGGSLDGYTMRDHSSYHATVHPDHIGDATAIFASMFGTPSFTDIRVERSIILEEILDSLDERGRVIDLDTVAHREAFPNHTLGFSIDGPRRNIRRFAVEDLFAHRRAFYGAKNTVLCFAGKIDPRRCRALATTAFGDLPAGRRAREVAPAPVQGPPKLVFVRSDDPQTRARLSFRVASALHADHPVLSLIRRLLDGGLSARLPAELIERQGIAYDVSADLESFSDCGLFSFEFAVAHKKLATAIEEIGRLIVDLRSSFVGEDELERIRRRARINLELSFDAAPELDNWFGASELFADPISPEARLKEFEATTPEMIRRVARRYFTGARLTAAAVGGADVTNVRAARRALKHLAESL